jgi:PBSX family phage terminase large subunit
MTAAIDLNAVTKVLSPAQIRSVVESQQRINVWEGSIRSGKTIASLLRFLIFVANPPRDGELVIIGKTRETIYRNLFAPLMNPNLFGIFAKQVHYNAGASEATIFGRTVHVIGANDAKAESKIRGMTVAGAYVDEITVLPRAFFDMLVGRCSVPGAKIFGTTNPDNPQHWLRKEYLLRAQQTELATWHFTIDDNPHLDPSYVAWLKATYTGLWYRRFILGQWVQAEGAIYDMWDPDRHVVPTLPPIHRWVSLGVDYGTVNPFAALLIGIGRGKAPNDPVERSRLYLAGEYRYDSRAHRRQLTDVQYSRQLRDWLARFPVPHQPDLVGVRPEWTVVDPSAASFVTQLYDDGLTPTLADNAVLDGIRLVSSLLSQDLLLVRDTCTGWIEEAPGYAWDDKAAAEGEDKPIKANDHSLDGGRYGIKTTEFTWRPELSWAQAA